MADSPMLTDTQRRDVAHKLSHELFPIKPTELQYLEAGAKAQAEKLIAWGNEICMTPGHPSLLTSYSLRDRWRRFDCSDCMQQLKQEVELE